MTVDGHVSPDELFAVLRTHAPADAVYVKESTSTSAAFWAQMDLAHQGSYYFPASGGLGFGLPAAVGAQLAHPDRRVIGLIGDGSANYGITALWTAARYGVPVVIVILKNGTYGALRWFAEILDAGETPGLDVPGIDFVRIAEGYGVQATSVCTAKDFVVALEEALAGTRPVVIEVLTAPGGAVRRTPARSGTGCFADPWLPRVQPRSSPRRHGDGSSDGGVSPTDRCDVAPTGSPPTRWARSWRRTASCRFSATSGCCQPCPSRLDIRSMRLVSVFVWMCRARAVLAKLLELAKYAVSVPSRSVPRCTSWSMSLPSDRSKKALSVPAFAGSNRMV